MDFLSKKHVFKFLNTENTLIRVHVIQVRSTNYNIWIEHKSKKYRDCLKLLKHALLNFEPDKLLPIVIVDEKKIGHGGISSYNHMQNIIYFNSYYCTQKRINLLIKDSEFAASNLPDIIKHELGHKFHWDAVKRFYHANKNKYNNISIAKHDLDSKIESYIATQESTY